MSRMNRSQLIAKRPVREGRRLVSLLTQRSPRKIWYLKKASAGLVGGVLLLAAACGTGTGQDDAVGEVADQASVAVTEVPATATVPSTTRAPLTAVPTTTAAPPTPTTVPPVSTAPPTTAAALPTDATELLRTAFENSATRSVRGEMHMNMSILFSVSAEFWSDGSGNFSMVMSFDQMLDEDATGFGFEMRFVEGAAYVSLAVPEEMRDLADDAMPQGWFTLDAATAAEMGIVCPSPLLGATPNDGLCRLPNDNLYLIEHVQSAEIVGEADISGIATTQVRATLNYAAALEDYVAEPAGGDGSIPFVGDMLPGEITYDIWIDRDGLTRRMSIDIGSLMRDMLDNLDDPEIEDAQEEIDDFLELLLSDVSNVLNFYDYGADITIEAPPADEIVGEFGDLMGSDFGEASATAPEDGNS